jgi:hypothetical protein
MGRYGLFHTLSLFGLIFALCTGWGFTHNHGSSEGQTPSVDEPTQQTISGEVAVDGNSAICFHKPALLHHIEQLSFYLKADCQRPNSSFIGCSCWPPSCAPGCRPRNACCPQNSTFLLTQLEEFNSFYAANFGRLFGIPSKKEYDEL